MIDDFKFRLLNQRKIEEQMKSMRNMLNKRFGIETWSEIIELRKKRIKELKEAQEKAAQIAKANAISNKNLLKEVWKWTWQLMTIVGMVFVVWGWLSYASKGKIPFIF